MIKWLVGFIGLIALAFLFPFVREVYDYAEGNGTGILYAAGGTTTNDAIMAFLPIGIPVILFVGIIIYAVIGRNKNEGGSQ